MEHGVSELCNKETILQRNYRNLISQSFSCNSFVQKNSNKKIGRSYNKMQTVVKGLHCNCCYILFGTEVLSSQVGQSRIKS